MKNAMHQLNKSGVAKSMGEFEKVFEDLDVQTEGMSGALDAVAGTSSADSQAINDLLAEMQGQGALEA